MNHSHLRDIKQAHPKKTQVYFGKSFYEGWCYVGFSQLRAQKVIADRILCKTPDDIKNQLQGVFQKYSTPLIELMGKAIEEFWLNHNHEAPAKKEAIISWLLEQGKEISISEREALAIDSIIRPPKQKLGGNKSFKITKGGTQKTQV